MSRCAATDIGSNCKSKKADGSVLRGTYTSPPEKSALELLFDNIKHVIVNHKPIPLEARHRNVFRIYTLSEIQKLEMEHYS